jgi:uncharacterized protein (UPF0332 family)
LTPAFLQKAETSIKSAKVLLDLGDTDGACSGAYYAMYDATRATLAWAGVSPQRGEFKTHHGVIAAFGLHLVKPGLFPAEPGRAIQRVQSLRQVADYEEVPVPHDRTAEAVQVAQSFVATATALICRPHPKPSQKSPQP